MNICLLGQNSSCQTTFPIPTTPSRERVSRLGTAGPANIQKGTSREKDITLKKNCNWCWFPGSSVILLVMLSAILHKRGTVHVT